MENNKEVELVELSEEDVVESEVKIIESNNPYVLCTLEGIFMVIEDDNGNGRWYLRDTIQKGILENDYVSRMLASKALLGESHHPLDRTSIWSDEACICTRELWIDSTGKYLMGRADVLDTPKGRIVYTLAKYGTKIGISARANGKGVKQGGHLVIKPEHYYFKTFDVVLNPGFKEARPAIFESDGRTPLKVYEECEDPLDLMYEELQDMVLNKSCDTKMLKDYIEYCDSDKLKELIPIMEDVSTEPSEGETSTSNIPNEDLKEELETIREELEASKILDEKNWVARMNYDSEIGQLRSENEELEETVKELIEELEEFKQKTSSEANDLIEELMTQIKEKDREISKCYKIISLYEENNSDLSDDVDRLNEEKKELEQNVINLSESIEEMEEAIEAIDEEPVVDDKPQKLFNKKVDLFNATNAILNEETVEEKSVSNINRVNMIKSLGGK